MVFVGQSFNSPIQRGHSLVAATLTAHVYACSNFSWFPFHFTPLLSFCFIFSPIIYGPIFGKNRDDFTLCCRWEAAQFRSLTYQLSGDSTIHPLSSTVMQKLRGNFRLLLHVFAVFNHSSSPNAFWEKNKEQNLTISSRILLQIHRWDIFLWS